MDNTATAADEREGLVVQSFKLTPRQKRFLNDYVTRQRTLQTYVILDALREYFVSRGEAWPDGQA